MSSALAQKSPSFGELSCLLTGIGGGTVRRRRHGKADTFVRLSPSRRIDPVTTVATLFVRSSSGEGRAGAQRLNLRKGNRKIQLGNLRIQFGWMVSSNTVVAATA